MFFSLRFKLWFLLLILVLSLGIVFNETSSRLIQENIGTLFKSKLSGVVRAVNSWWERETNNTLQAAALYADSEKILSYSTDNLHKMLQQELKKLLIGSGYHDIEVTLKSGIKISGLKDEIIYDTPLNLAEPRINLSQVFSRIREGNLEICSVVPIAKTGQFIGRLLLVKRWSKQRMESMKKSLQADLALAKFREPLMTTLDKERENALFQALNLHPDFPDRIFSVALAGEPFSFAVVDFGETEDREQIRMYCGISESQMISMIRQSRQQTFNITILALSISFLLAVLFSEKVLISRIRKIAEGAKKIAHDELSFRLNDNALDEVSELARAFNEMAEKLLEHRNKLLLQNEELQLYIQSLENMKNYIQNILGSLATGVITWKTGGRISTVNSSAANTLAELGLSDQGLHLRKFVKRMELSSRKRFMKALKELIRNNVEGKLFEIEFLMKPNSGYKVMQAGLTYLRDVDKKAYGMVLTLEDITQKKIIEQQLYHADKLSSIGRLAASVAHEIKNPLSSIKTLGQLLQEEIKEGDAVEYVNVIVSEVNRLNSVVEQLLKYAKPEESKFTEINVEEILKPVVTLISHELERNKIKLELSFPEKLILKVDSEKMKQVFLNLFFNAVHAMPNGGIIFVRVFQEEKSPWIVVEVEDQGEGIDENICSKIFEPFFTTKQRGSGLGLAIVKKIIDMHGGEIKVASQKGKGTKFTILLPRNSKE